MDVDELPLGKISGLEKAVSFEPLWCN